MVDPRRSRDNGFQPAASGVSGRVTSEEPHPSKLAEEIIRISTEFDGAEHSPMRADESSITLRPSTARPTGSTLSMLVTRRNRRCSHERINGSPGGETFAS